MVTEELTWELYHILTWLEMCADRDEPDVVRLLGNEHSLDNLDNTDS